MPGMPKIFAQPVAAMADHGAMLGMGAEVAASCGRMFAQAPTMPPLTNTPS